MQNGIISFGLVAALTLSGLSTSTPVQASERVRAPETDWKNLSKEVSELVKEKIRQITEQLEQGCKDEEKIRQLAKQLAQDCKDKEKIRQLAEQLEHGYKDFEENNNLSIDVGYLFYLTIFSAYPPKDSEGRHVFFTFEKRKDFEEKIKTAPESQKVFFDAFLSYLDDIAYKKFDAAFRQSVGEGLGEIRLISKEGLRQLRENILLVLSEMKGVANQLQKNFN